MKIEYLISISGAILVVYRTHEGDYYYEISFWDGSLYQPTEIYDTAEKARDVGVEAIEIVIGYR
jgi:hypothetical protein